MSRNPVILKIINIYFIVILFNDGISSEMLPWFNNGYPSDLCLRPDIHDLATSYQI
jgi:hypothetical protein